MLLRKAWLKKGPTKKQHSGSTNPKINADDNNSNNIGLIHWLNARRAHNNVHVCVASEEDEDEDDHKLFLSDGTSNPKP